MIRRLFLLAALALIATTPGFAQDDDIDAQIKKAMEDVNKPASRADMKKLEQQAKAQSDQMEAEQKAEEAKQKAAAQAVVDAKGPTSFPDWTPQVPQFTPSGPPARKLVDGEPKVIQIGTSPLPRQRCVTRGTNSRIRSSVTNAPAPRLITRPIFSSALETARTAVRYDWKLNAKPELK